MNIPAHIRQNAVLLQEQREGYWAMTPNGSLLCFMGAAGVDNVIANVAKTPMGLARFVASVAAAAALRIGVVAIVLATAIQLLRLLAGAALLDGVALLEFAAATAAWECGIHLVLSREPLRRARVAVAKRFLGREVPPLRDQQFFLVRTPLQDAVEV